MSDTIKLLQECDSGIKMAIESIDEVLEKIEDVELMKLLQESRKQHERLGDEIFAQLKMRGAQEKEPSLMARGMSWMKTNMKLGMDDSTKTAADLMTDGCDMGLKSLHQYLNEYKNAEDKAKDLCKKLISIEEDLSKSLRMYL